MTSVKDQAVCGSCYAESPTGTLEAKYNIEQGSQKNLNTAEQVFVSPCFSPTPVPASGDRGDEVFNRPQRPSVCRMNRSCRTSQPTVCTMFPMPMILHETSP